MTSIMFETLLKIILTSGLWELLILLAFLGIIGSILRSSGFKGWTGELFVRLMFWLRLPKKDYTVIHDATLPTEDGTTQIDHIVVSRYGVFVIETKNMRGWIFGSEKQATWTQTIFKHKSSFQNPLRQNYKHTQTLCALLDLPPESVHSVIVFVGNSTFKSDMPKNVTYAGGCVDYIRSFESSVFDDEEVTKIVDAIRENRLAQNRTTQQSHIRCVQEIKERKSESSCCVPLIETDEHQEATVTPVCPRCGCVMILRTARRGGNAGSEFWGCSSYPACRGTRPVNN